ncbi:primosomal protein N' (replication factor Y) [Caldicoprobacter guelmensis]|uniref:primosomal protein N' n=1 Tax=Caldicoprobacter guelmensis TaxID=1170224 RepID=UPI00195B55AC|nr:primosomal protein N' (replication factor Y) [Caldicoprobacter guelmensis]
MKGEVVYAGVIIDQAHPSLDKVFLYLVPQDLMEKVQVGSRVQVPFGPSNRKVEGYVIMLESETDIPSERVKAINKVMDDYPVLPRHMIPLIEWMKDEYHCLTIDAIRCIVPPGLRANIKKKAQKLVFLNDPGDLVEEHISYIASKSQYMADVLRLLAQQDGIPLEEVRAATRAPLSSIKSLEKRGWIRIEQQEVYRDPWAYEPDIGIQPKVLTQEQRQAVEELETALIKGYGKFLLQGVTGSGKTEVYIQAAQKALALNKQVIVLVPEISLTPQTVERFKSHFGQRVAILHSGLSLGERYDEWRRIRNQQVDVVVGARSAVFAPFERLGLIIIDEAHEDSYKSDMQPKYHAVDVARKRCELEGAVLLLGSATPAITDYYLAQKGVYKKIEMKYRVDQKPLPPVEIVDMRKEIELGNRSILSGALYRALKDVLQKGQQAILLINRRGYAQFVSCRSCGFVVKCSNCDISLTYHAYDNSLKCHYCGAIHPYPNVCPACGSKYIKHFGIGTQKAEEEIGKLFPQARVIRMDMDTTSTKGAHQRILKAFGEGLYDILLGTQMIAKGLDFPRVTLVGVIAADTVLNLPDYRSPEKAFQLITQVAGRAGRGPHGGRVIIQTYQPQHYAIQFAARHDYIGFYSREIEIRKQFMYPPFSHMIRILIMGEKEEDVIKLANDSKDWLKQRIDGSYVLKQGLDEIGAYSAPLERINNKYRWHVLIRIKPDDIYRQAYHGLVDEYLEWFIGVKETIIVDFHPLSLL